MLPTFKYRYSELSKLYVEAKVCALMRIRAPLVEDHYRMQSCHDGGRTCAYLARSSRPGAPSCPSSMWMVTNTVAV
jgi:hypothetical protein